MRKPWYRVHDHSSLHVNCTILFSLDILLMNSHSTRWWSYGYLRAGPWVCGSEASPRGWYINLVCVGLGAGYVSRTGICGAWLEMAVNCLCCTGTYFLRGLVVSPICPIIEFLVYFFQALGERNRARRVRRWGKFKMSVARPFSCMKCKEDRKSAPKFVSSRSPCHGSNRPYHSSESLSEGPMWHINHVFANHS